MMEKPERFSEQIEAAYRRVISAMRVEADLHTVFKSAERDLKTLASDHLNAVNATRTAQNELDDLLLKAATGETNGDSTANS